MKRGFKKLFKNILSIKMPHVLSLFSVFPAIVFALFHLRNVVLLCRGKFVAAVVLLLLRLQQWQISNCKNISTSKRAAVFV
jgi:hypothetical protein